MNVNWKNCPTCGRTTLGELKCVFCNVPEGAKISCDTCGILKETFWMHQFKGGKTLCGSCYGEKLHKETNKNLGISDWTEEQKSNESNMVNKCRTCGRNPASIQNTNSEHDGRCYPCYKNIEEARFWEKNKYCNKCGQEQEIKGTFVFCKNCFENSSKPVGSQCKKCKSAKSIEGFCKCTMDAIQEINSRPPTCNSYLDKNKRCGECPMCLGAKHHGAIEDQRRELNNWNIKVRSVQVWVEKFNKGKYPECPYCQAEIGLDTWISPQFDDSVFANIGRELEKEKWIHVENCSSASAEQKNEAAERRKNMMAEDDVKYIKTECKNCGKNDWLSQNSLHCVDCIMSYAEYLVQKSIQEGRINDLQKLWNQKKSIREAHIKKLREVDPDAAQKLETKYNSLENEIFKETKTTSSARSRKNDNNDKTGPLIVGGIIIGVLIIGGLVWWKLRKRKNKPLQR